MIVSGGIFMVERDPTKVKQVLPQRYPFIFVDKVTDVEFLKYAIGYKNVSWNEWYFPFHDDDAVMPELLIVEAIAQLAGFAVYGPGYYESLGLITRIEDVEFIAPVRPGDRLDMYYEVTRFKHRVLYGHGYAAVDGKIVLRIGSCDVVYID